MGRGWIVCGWCGVRQIAKTPRRGIFARAAGFMLLLQAVGLVAATVALAAVWASRGWTVERGETLGIIWLGVMVVLAFLAWVSINVNRSPERQPLFAPRERLLT